MDSLRENAKALTDQIHLIDDEIVFLGNHQNEQPGNHNLNNHYFNSFTRGCHHKRNKINLGIMREHGYY